MSADIHVKRMTNVLEYKFLNFLYNRKMSRRERPVNVQLDKATITEIRKSLASIHPKIETLSDSYIVEFAIELFEDMITARIPQYIHSRERIRLNKLSKSQAMIAGAETRRKNKREAELLNEINTGENNNE